ncbi:MAG: LysM peptidoglycan-binding domain-containing protein [Bacteriovorax sp.]|nr:LysM peptidoglycan-binding domain-containing protein [Bacteriovorax sp.]
MRKISSITFLILLISSCSLSNSNKESVSSKPSDELEFTVDTFGETSGAEIKVEEQKVAETQISDDMSAFEKAVDKTEETVEVKHEEMKLVTNTNEGKEQPMTAIEEPKFKDYQKEVDNQIANTEKIEILETPPEIAPKVSSTELGKEEQYYVQKGDTLMMVAFKIYGDYRKWKDLRTWNKDKLKYKIGPGVVLKYYVPERSFGWQPSGLPYLVKTGDTLQIISMDKYGTTRKWKNIYENNRPLILNPNLIFAGFTLYYVPTRDIASKRR